MLSGCFLKYFTSLGFLSSKTLYWLAAVSDYGEMSIFIVKIVQKIIL